MLLNLKTVFHICQINIIKMVLPLLLRNKRNNCGGYFIWQHSAQKKTGNSADANPRNACPSLVAADSLPHEYIHTQITKFQIQLCTVLIQGRTVPSQTNNFPFMFSEKYQLLDVKYSADNHMWTLQSGTFVQLLLQWKSSITYFKHVCSLWYPACNAHHIVMWPVQHYSVFPHYLINYMIKKKVVQHNVFQFCSTTFVCNISHSKKN
jgi:hypothetical protein